VSAVAVSDIEAIVTPAVECRGITKTYRSTDARLGEALAPIDLAVAPGEFHVIIGPSGCGKSTLLWIMAGLTEASAGAVLVDGQPLTGPTPERVAMVFQEASLFPWRNLADNVAFGPEMRGRAKTERRREACRYIELVGLAGFEHQYPHELSGGMQQRAAIAQALVQNPDILLMDEPFGALDEQTRMAMGDELLRIWEATGKTVVFITHSLQEAVYLGDRVTVLAASPGRIVDTMSVPLPRPRAPEMMTWSEFERARVQLWTWLRGPVTSRAAAIGGSRAPAV
jgi:NitT/TauT family transport system ATP-binding protein